MARERPDPARLLPGYYPFHGQVDTRFGDLDPYVHVNNVATASLLEEGRSQFFTWLDALGPLPEEPSWRMIAEVRIRYLAQIYHPSSLHVGAAVTEINRSSFILSQGLFLGERCVTLCDTVYVHTDRQRAVTLTDFWRERLGMAGAKECNLTQPATVAPKQS